MENIPVSVFRNSLMAGWNKKKFSIRTKDQLSFYKTNTNPFLKLNKKLFQRIKLDFEKLYFPN